MHNAKAVIIEDDQDVALLIEMSLTGAGFAVRHASDGWSGVDLVKEFAPDVVTLDMGLPGIDGLETARQIRTHSDAHIIMLTGRSDEADILMGLDAGADDYLTKPFRPRELRARIAAIMRRRNASPAVQTVAPSSTVESTPSADLLEHNGLQLRVQERKVHLHGEPVVLTRTEFDLLTEILTGGSRVRSKAELIRRLHNDEYVPDAFVSAADERALAVHIGNLRRKLGEDVREPLWIESVRGVGYRRAAAR